MTERPPSAPPSGAGWFADPGGRHEFRYHNGRTWTADVSDDGRRFVDPLPESGRFGDRPSADRRNRSAVAALVFGVIAVALGLVPFLFVVGALSAVLAVVFGTIGVRRSQIDGHRRSAAVAGLVTGSLGALAAVAGGFLTVALIDAIDRYEEPGPHRAEITACSGEDSTWTAVGSVENLDDEQRSYTLSVDFVRPGTDNVQARVRVRIDDVGPGGREGFEVRRFVDLDEIECVVSAVDGPPPFGIDTRG